MYNSIEVFASCTIGTLEQFSGFFENASKEAFRLEILPEYSVQTEQESISQFVDGKADPSSDFNRDWHNILTNAKKRKVNFYRGRYLHSPLTAYERFEINWGYKKNIVLEEKIFLVTDKEIEKAKEILPILGDFWLFDESDCFLMVYDAVGSFCGVLKMNSDHLAPYIKLKEYIINNCVLITESEKWNMAMV